MQPTGMQQTIRFQTPARPQRQATPNIRTPRPRTPVVRTRTPTSIQIRTPVNTSQPHATSTPMMTPRQRVTLTRLTSPNQIQPIISVGPPKTVVSITSPPRGPNIVRTQTPVFSKASPVTQTQIQNTVTSTTPNTSGLAEDLEESIQAARITKQPAIQSTESYTVVQQGQPMQQLNDSNDHRIITLQSGTQMSVAEYKQRQASQSVTKQLTGIRPINRPLVQNRQPRFASPNVIRTPRPVMVKISCAAFQNCKTI